LFVEAVPVVSDGMEEGMFAATLTTFWGSGWPTGFALAHSEKGSVRKSDSNIAYIMCFTGQGKP
jgi:hypothetical protein